jgi:predicted metal-dependent hydrolase
MSLQPICLLTLLINFKLKTYKCNIKYDFIAFAEASAIHYEQDEAIKQTKYDNFAKTELTSLLEKLNEILTKNNGHIALGKYPLQPSSYSFDNAYQSSET